jgi:hypothetical protein
MTDISAAPPAEAGPAEAPAYVGAFTPEQQKQMAKWEVERGRLTQAEADAMLQGDNAAPGATPAAGLSPEAAEIDAAFPPAAPHQYQFPSYSGGPGVGLTPEETEFDTMARGWLAEARFPANLGSSLAKEVDAEARRHSTMSKIERTLYGKSQRLLLEKLWGDQFQTKLDAAEIFLQTIEAKRPGLADVLVRTGAANSARVIAALFFQAERQAARQSKR